MKKTRKLLIPASLMILSSCSPSNDADLQNKYNSMQECLTDNNPQEIQDAICKENSKMPKAECISKNSLESISAKYTCTELRENGSVTYLGPEYPSSYYEKTSSSHSGGGTGFLMGYWMGRSMSSGVYHRNSSSSYSHSGFKSFGGSRSLGHGISRGGFGSSARGFSIGG